MSMLSAQCDELRAMAESVGLAMPQAATLMMEAADTIDNLHRENAKLRELAADMLKAMRHMEDSAGMDVMVGYSPWFAPKLHELGIEVDE